MADDDISTFELGQRCPWCNANNEAASTSSEHARPPRDGDVLLCFECSMPYVLDAGRTRRMTEADFDLLPLPMQYQLAAVMRRNDQRLWQQETRYWWQQATQT